jgi:hypothetical protein
MKLTVGNLLPGASHGWRSMYSACALHTCKNTVFMRSIQSRVGISLANQWYCSMDCFVAAARSRYYLLSAAKVVDIRHIPRRSIGHVLLSKGHMNEDQLRLAITESKLRGRSLEETLRDLELASERQIAIAKAAQWGCPVFDQGGAIREIEADIPLTLLRECSAVPLHFSATAKWLVLGFVDRIEHSLLGALESVTGMRPQPCFVTQNDFAEQMTRFTPASDCEEVVSGVPVPSAEMARITGRYAIDVGASDVRFARCRDFIWTRLTGKRKRIDLLFKVRGTSQARELGFMTNPDGTASSLG